MATNQANAQEPTMEEILASIRRIISEDAEEKPAEKPKAEAPKAQKAPPPPIVEDEPEDDDVLDLTDIVEEDEEPELAASADDIEDDDEDVVMVARPAPAPAPKPKADPLPLPPAPEPHALLSEEAAEHASSAFSALSRSLRVSDGEPKSLEHLVQEMLKPVLKDWLNDHLPAIVERLVQAEIDRVARKGRP